MARDHPETGSGIKLVPIADDPFEVLRDAFADVERTLIELLLVAYREERDTERAVSNAINLVEGRGDVETVVTAATYIEDHGITPFGALTSSNPATILWFPATTRTKTLRRAST